MDLLCIVGPTAVGKTKLSLALAKAFDAEIISGDAMQFYRGMDIGTAKATNQERAMVKHHLLDILNVTDNYSVVDYQHQVRQTINDIHEAGKLPILVGGSGLYIQSVIENYKFHGDQRKDTDNENLPLKDLQEKLKEKNPKLYDAVDIFNRRRVLRALEKDDKDLQEQTKPYYDDVLIIGLRTDRETLYERINQRVLDMMDQGLLNEAKALYDLGIDSQATKAIGYKELYLYFDGDITLDEAIQMIQKHSRHYAKRQMTWFRNKMDVTWFDVDLDDFDRTIDQVIEHIKKAHQV